MGTVVCDVDGTLLNKGVIPIRSTIHKIKGLAKDNKIVIITGRPETERGRTERALKDAGVPYNKLLMNPYGPDSQQSSKAAHAKSVMPVTMAFDNDAAMRTVYKNMGIRQVLAG